MKRYLLWPMFALAAIALALIPSPAPAAEELPFSAHYESSFTGEFEGPYAVHTGTGTGTHLGDFSVVAYVHIQGNGKKATGWITLTAANGDLLDVVCDQTWDEGTSSYVGPYTIVGGTGRFEGAGGSGTIAVLVVAGLPVTLDGTISF